MVVKEKLAVKQAIGSLTVLILLINIYDMLVISRAITVPYVLAKFLLNS